MKRLIILTVLPALFLSSKPKTTSEDFCLNLKKIIEASKENFEPLKLERKKGVLDMFYTSKVNLPGCTDSKLILGEVAWSYTCKMFEGKDKALALKDYQNQINKVQNCLGPNWQAKSIENPGKQKKTIFSEKLSEGCGTTVNVLEGESATKPGYFKVNILVQNN